MTVDVVGTAAQATLPITGFPFVSVVVPVRNEAAYLRRCLMAVLDQQYPADRLEVLVVDGGSCDNTRAIATECAAFGTVPVRILHNPGRLAAPALNIGIRAAIGDIIVRVDGHTAIAPGYVQHCVDALRTSGAQVVGGPRHLKGLGFWGQVIAAALSSPFASPAHFHRATTPRTVDTVFLGAFQRSTLLDVGLYDEHLAWNEDYELNFRIRRAGGRVYSTGLAQSTYFARESLVALIKQFWGYGRGKAMVLRRHPRSIAPRHVIAPVFLVALLSACLVAALGQPIWLLSLLGAYAAGAAWFARRARSRRSTSAAAIALAFVCIHLAWAAGMLSEMLNPLAGRRR
jgi:succinoglycan biosynthesis protein ExoA